MGAPDQHAETWRAGDMAECIRDGWPACVPGATPTVGSRYLVTSVSSGPCFCGCGRTLTALQLLGFGNRQAWDASAFRKIVAPDVGVDRRVDRPVEELV